MTTPDAPTLRAWHGDPALRPERWGAGRPTWIFWTAVHLSPVVFVAWRVIGGG